MKIVALLTTMFLCLGAFVYLQYADGEQKRLIASLAPPTETPEPPYTETKAGMSYNAFIKLCDKPSDTDDVSITETEKVDWVHYNYQRTDARLKSGCHGRFVFKGQKLTTISR